MGIKKMQVRITHDGRTEIKVEGGNGEDCLDFTKALEQAVGQVQERNFTEDYDNQERIQVGIKDQVNL